MINKKELKLLINENRKKIVLMVYQSGVGHVGGALSINDILTCIYETDVDFSSEKRSKVILSKGHAVPAQYVNLAHKGIINEEDFKTFRQLNSKLQGHPTTLTIQEVDATTGLLGQGYSLAVGVAIAKKYNQDNTRVYAIAGDGEIQEGQIWEALLSAQHYKLNNIIFIIDYNKLSSSGNTNEVINLEPIDKKFEAFNLNVLRIDGHNVDEILDALNSGKSCVDKPTMIIADTIKGKGVSFMESVGKWHSSGLTDEEYTIALKDLDEIERSIYNEL